MAFYQAPPELGNQYEGDSVLRSYLARKLPPDLLKRIEPELLEVGELSGGELHRQGLAEYAETPKLVQWDAWGHRVDQIELTPLWKKCQRIAAEKGLVAAGYEKSKYGEHARTVQFALAYVLDPSTMVYSCPLAMTDGAAKTLIASKNQALIDRAVPRLTSRDPAVAWTSGQWMTERTGGSDVAISETVARPDGGDAFRLFGTKWFSSATTANMALTLARPEGNPAGGKGLALFFVEVRDEQGRLNNILVNRLKDKLGTRMVPTAELTLDGTRAIPVMGTSDGILNVTRTWNAIGASCGMRRAIALARDYAVRRVAFGAPLIEKPLHVDTLAWMQAEAHGAFMLTFRAIELLGREEAGLLTEGEAALLRLITPIAKLTTAKQAVAVCSEALESFGGAGYIEDTGLPRMLRDAQVLPIWEGTTNVLSLDVLRALGRAGTADPLAPIEEEVRGRTVDASRVKCTQAAGAAVDAVNHTREWLGKASAGGIKNLEAGARRFALTLGRALEVALLIDHAVYDKQHGALAAAAARRLAGHGIDLLHDEDWSADAALLARG
jgi:alkylation response protein AidB-like acyl-CoA dehydrogenase